jgi:hypothetical protein
VAATKVVRTKNYEPPMYLVFRLLCCCAVKPTSFYSSMYIYDWESRSVEPSSLVILHRERTNKIFEKRATARLLLQVLYHGSSTSSSNTRRWSSPSTWTPLDRSSSLRNWKSHMISPIKSCLTYWICWSMYAWFY